MKVLKKTPTGEKLKISASLLANNVEFIMNELNIKRGLTYTGRLGNMILYMVLPRYHGNQCEPHLITVSSDLEKALLIRVMAEQSTFIVEIIRQKDPEFSKWVEGLLFKFLKKSADEWLAIEKPEQARIIKI